MTDDKLEYLTPGRQKRLLEAIDGFRKAVMDGEKNRVLFNLGEIVSAGLLNHFSYQLQRGTRKPRPRGKKA